MLRFVFAVALLLISGLLSTSAVASEDLKKNTSEKVRKIDAYLEALGINNPRIKEFTSTIGTRMEGKFVRLAEERFESGRLVLHYAATPKIGIKQMQLKYQPDNSHSEYTATTKSVMWNYKFKF